MTKNPDMLFHGSIPALVTPMNKDGTIDEQSYRQLIDWQIDQGSNALVPVGTTGESPTLSHDEHRHVIQIAIDSAKKRVPVIAGTGSNCTKEAIYLTQQAQNDGADAALVVTPYYNKPSQDGLYQHFKTIASESDLPIIIYNIPGRSVIDMSDDTMTKLYHDCDNIIGVKDATAKLDRPLKMRLLAGKDFCQLSGEDATVAAYLAQGGHGCISVTANVAPKLSAALHQAWCDKDYDTFIDIRDILLPIHDAMFCCPSPAPAKYGLSLLGICGDNTRLPITPCDDMSKQQITTAMQQAGLL